MIATENLKSESTAGNDEGEKVASDFFLCMFARYAFSTERTSVIVAQIYVWGFP